jgi:hypothetical protein
MYLGSTHAGRRDWHIRGALCSGEPLLQFRKLLRVVPFQQAFNQAMQSPDVVRVLRAALNVGIQAEIIAVNTLGLFDVASLQKKGRKRMARGMHPCPRLDVFEVVVPTHTLPQMPKGQFEVSLVVLQFALEHHFADPKNFSGVVVEEPTTARHPRNAVVE